MVFLLPSISCLKAKPIASAKSASKKIAPSQYKIFGFLRPPLLLTEEKFDFILRLKLEASSWRTEPSFDCD